MNTDKISIIIPIHNSETFLRKSLESALAQDYPNVEIVAVNDGSTDGTADILNEYADRIRIITRPVCGGVSAARNTGLENATGSLITFLDSDDMLYPDTLSSLARPMAEDPGIDMVIGQAARTMHHDRRKHAKRHKIVPAKKVLLRSLYQTGVIHSLWAKLYRRELFSNKRFLEGLWYEDMEIFHRLMRDNPKVALIPTLVYYYRRNPASFLSIFSAGRVDALAVTTEIEQIMSNSGDKELLRAARDRRLSASFNILGLLWRNPDVEVPRREEIVKECINQIQRLRLDSLKNPSVRFKNKIGILVSYLPTPLFRTILTHFN